MNRLLLLFLSLCLPMFLLAQQDIKITGTVTDANNEAIPGVSIIIKGSTTGTITDLDGNYTIQVQNDAILVFSFMGFESQEVPVEGKTKINIVLKESVEWVDEVVVIGYGTVKKSDLTGSVSSLRGEDLTKIPSVSPEQALQGKVAGVRVTSNSGEPGSAPTVRVRGVGTFHDAAPIFVVDGMIMDDISFLNPSDIQSMEVLKDASATAIYGFKGANGVILITTKQGGFNTKPKIKVGIDYSMQTIQKYIDVLDGKEFAETLNKITPGTINNVSLVDDVDWQKEVYEDYAPIQNYQISASGGTENLSYYIGGGYFKQNGIIPKSTYEKLSLKVNNQYKLNKNITIGHHISVTKYDKQNPANVVASTLRAWPINKPYDKNGELTEVRGNGNPLASIEYNNNITNGFWTVSNFFGEIKFLKDFTFKSSYGIDYKNNYSQSFTPVFYVSPTQNSQQTGLSKTKTEYNNWLWENTLSFNKQIGKHHFDAVIGYTAHEKNRELISGKGKELLRDNILYLRDDLEEFDLKDEAFIQSGISYLFRVNYSLMDKYLFTASMRRDYSSKFSKNNRNGDFPSMALGWKVSDEQFLQDVSWLSTLKLRASWGVIGNEKVDESNRFTKTEYTGAVFGTPESYNTGLTYSKTGNPLLRWEEAEQTDIGLEIGILENKFTAELDYYNRITHDILIQLLLPGHLGNGSYAYTFFNAADVLNRGIEFNLTWKDKIGDFNYRINAIGNSIYNEVIKMGSDLSSNTLVMGSLGNGQNVKLVEKGYPIGYFYGYKVDGVFQNEAELEQYPHLGTQGVGDFRYKDVNGDGEITPDDRTQIGSPVPDFIYGLGLEVSYKDISLALDFQGEYGKEIYNGKNAVRAGQYNYEAFMRDAWSGEGSTNSEPQPTAGGVNYSQSDWFVHDGSFLRLRNITLGYTLPKSVISKAKMTNASVYFRGTNVFTLTEYTGYTPEIGGGIRMSGIDTGLYPVTSIYSLGLSINF